MQFWWGTGRGWLDRTEPERWPFFSSSSSFFFGEDNELFTSLPQIGRTALVKLQRYRQRVPKKKTTSSSLPSSLFGTAGWNTTRGGRGASSRTPSRLSRFDNAVAIATMQCNRFRVDFTEIYWRPPLAHFVRFLAHSLASIYWNSSSALEPFFFVLFSVLSGLFFSPPILLVLPINRPHAKPHARLCAVFIIHRQTDWNLKRITKIDSNVASATRRIKRNRQPPPILLSYQ